MSLTNKPSRSSRRTWKQLNRLLGRGKRATPITADHDIAHEGDAARTFSGYFSNLSCTSQRTLQPPAFPSHSTSFILEPFTREDVAVLQVFCVCYSDTLAKSGHADRVHTVQHHFLDCVQNAAPEMLKKMKIHLLLHLPDNILDFGPTANYNTER